MKEEELEEGSFKEFPILSFSVSPPPSTLRLCTREAEDRRVIKQEKTKGMGRGIGGRRESRNEWYSVYSRLSYVVRAQPTSVPASRH